jgi:hypothetical protein
MKARITRREFVKKSAAATAALSVATGRVLLFGTRAFAVSIDPTATKKFASSLRGRLILPGSNEYDTARKLWNSRYDKHPAMIARCAESDDVRRAIEFARDNELVVSIRSGGHDQAGYATNDGGLIVDLGGLNEVKLDLPKNSVSAGGGSRVGELYSVVEPSGLGVVSGGCMSVGVGGLTLGGGESALSSKYGMACDNVIQAEIVIADGRVLTVSNQENRDLFWAMRGGSGNFGVVTRFVFRLVPVSKLLSGVVTYPIAKRRDVLRTVRDYRATAPDELTIGLGWGTPFPNDLSVVELTYCGDPKEGERLIAPLRSIAKPVSDTIKVLPLTQAVTEEEPQALRNRARDDFFPQISDDLIDGFSEALEQPPPIFQVGLFDIRGAVCRGDSAFPLRRPGFDAWTWVFWRDSSEQHRATSWLEQVRQATEKHAAGAYVNGLNEGESDARIRAAYGANYDRLVVLKNKFDPTNFFRMNQNIRPTV